MHNYTPPKSDLSTITNKETKPKLSKRKVNAEKSELDFLPQSHFYHIHKDIFTALGIDVKDDNLFLIRETRMELEKESRINLLKADFEQRLEIMASKGIQTATLYISDPGGKFSSDDLNLFLSFLKTAYDDKKFVVTKLILEGHIRAPRIFTDSFITPYLECLFINKLWAFNEENLDSFRNKILQNTAIDFKLLYGSAPKPCTASCKGCKKQPCEVAQRKQVDYKIWMQWIDNLKVNHINCLPCQMGSEEKLSKETDNNNNSNNNNTNSSSNDNGDERLAVKISRKKIKTAHISNNNNNQSSTTQILTAIEPVQPMISVEIQEMLNHKDSTILKLQAENIRLNQELLEKNLYIISLRNDHQAKDDIITELQTYLNEAKAAQIIEAQNQIQPQTQPSIYTNPNFLFSPCPQPFIPDLFDIDLTNQINFSDNNNQESMEDTNNNSTSYLL